MVNVGKKNKRSELPPFTLNEYILCHNF